MHLGNKYSCFRGLCSGVIPPGKQQACPGRIPSQKQLHITRVIQMSPPTRETGNNGIPMSQSLPFFRGRGVGRKDLTDRSSSLQGEGRGRLENQEGAVTQQLLISIH